MTAMILVNIVVVITIFITQLSTCGAAFTYNVSKAAGLGRRFDGVGGLSGGGCSTRLLADYSNLSYSQLMDYLFLPGFGASLHILKVEIGGDVQSTDGTEPSHMHSANDENYERGYEWKVMVEAKRRNPNITLYGLSWGFPGWVGEGTHSPWTNSTVAYTMKWILGAKKYYNIDIDYIGIWNERSWDKRYTLALKAAITAAGLKTKIVGHDAGWNVCNDLSKDSEWAAAVDVIGAHYPGSNIGENCPALNKVQWSSEDMSLDYDTGALCWARALNQNYVRANLTATIAWDLVNSFYDRLDWAGVGILRAVEPWSGFYQIGRVLWVAAHWGQFTKSGWFFLQHGSGVGLLDNGGSYVALTDPTGQQLTIIVETMKRDSSQCAHSSSVHYNTTNQAATFQLDSSFAHVTQLFVFLTDLNTKDVNQSFVYKGILTLNNGAFSLQLPVGVLYTVSTINGTKGTYQPPPSMPFPLPYQDDFDRSATSSEAAYFSDQSGSWEIVDTSSSRGKTMRQMVTELPISWCSEAPYPYSVIGNSSWKQPLNISVDVMIESVGTAFVAIGVERGGCGVGRVGSHAIVFSINTTNNGLWQLTSSTAITKPLAYGNVSVRSGTWYTITLIVLEDHSEAYINGNLIGRCELNVSSSSGLVAIGSSWNYVQFDNFHLQSPKKT
jgi:galactosylceramidase